ncbi:hypothetical protein BDV93DRAFT_546238 [Ceratobasidium sp. AG-I]|nr:hypothetical protein BDV93DRAFT_546238 [Ceratobasidium sp. AG-I]
MDSHQEWDATPTCLARLSLADLDSARISIWSAECGVGLDRTTPLQNVVVDSLNPNTGLDRNRETNVKVGKQSKLNHSKHQEYDNSISTATLYYFNRKRAMSKKPGASKSAAAKPKPKPKPKPRATSTKSKVDTKSDGDKTEGSVGLGGRYIWKAEMERHMSETRNTIAIDPEEMKEHQELEEHRLGHGFISFGGVDDVASVVNIENDPNYRTNPRPLKIEHAYELADIFVIKGGKQDAESPVNLIVNRKFVSKELLAKMKAFDPNNTTDSPPRFELLREHAKREAELELRLTWRMDWDSLTPLTREQLAADSLALLDLRKNRPLAQIVNGSHRIQAMIILSNRLAPLRESIIEGLHDDSMEAEDCAEKMKDFMQATRFLTYRVEVFADDTPPHLLSRLGENKVKRINLVAGAGEHIWNESERLKNIIDVEMATGRSLEDAATDAVRSWLELQGKWVKGPMEGTGGKPKGKKAVKKEDNDEGGGTTAQATAKTTSTKKKKDEDHMMEFIKHPSTFTLAQDCRLALATFDKIVTASHAKAMATERGASFAAHVWIAIRLLFKIADIAPSKSGEEAKTANEFVDRFKLDDISADGHPEATSHWISSHPINSPWRTPILYSLFTPEAAKYFDECMKIEGVPLRDSLGFVDYDSDKTYLAVRRVFFRFADFFQDTKDEKTRQFRTQLKLYSMLQRWDKGACDDTFFFPAALLPAPGWLNDREAEIAAKQHTFMRPGDAGIWVLDALVDHTQLMWTVGRNAGNLWNTANWYKSSGSLHQLLLAYWERTDLGCSLARLQKVIEYLDDRRLHMALSIANERLAGPFEKMQPTFSADKTPAANYTGIDPICSRMGYALGSATDVNKLLKEARLRLTAMMLEDPFKRDDGPNRLPKIRREHKILQIVPDKIFEDPARFELWTSGWMGGSDKMRKSVIAAIGWGLLGREVSEATLPNALKEPSPLRWLLHVARQLLAIRKQPRAWWDLEKGPIFDLEVPKLAPAPPLQPVEPAHPLESNDTPAKNGRGKGKGKGAGKGETESKPQDAEVEPDDVDSVPEQEDDSAPRTETSTITSKAKTSGNCKSPISVVVPQNTNPRRSAPSDSLSQDAVPDKRQVRAKSDLDKGKAVVRRRSDEWDVEDETPEMDVEEDEEIEDGPSAPTAETPYLSDDDNVTEYSSSKQRRADTEETVLVDALKELLHVAPSHVVGIGALSSRFPEHLWGLNVARRQESSSKDASTRDKDLFWRVSSYSNCDLEVLKDISVERLKLRQSVVELATGISKMPMGGDFAVTMLNSADLFVINVAKHLKRRYKTSDQASVAEALSIALEDGLYSNSSDLIALEPDGDSLKIDLTNTLPSSSWDEEDALLGNQPIPYLLFHHPTELSGTSLDREDTIRMMRFFRSVWAPGRTRAESSVNAATNIAALVAGSRPTGDDPATVLIPPAIGEVPPPLKKGLSLATRLKGLFARPDTSNELWNRPHELLDTEGWKRGVAPPFLSAAHEAPVFSSGFYIPDHFEVPRCGVPDPMADKIQMHLTGNKAKFERVWSDTQYDELQEWNDWIVDRMTDLACEEEEKPARDKAEEDFEDENIEGEDEPALKNERGDDDDDIDELPLDDIALDGASTNFSGDILVPSTFAGENSQDAFAPAKQRRVPSGEGESDHSTDSEKRAARKRGDSDAKVRKRRRSGDVTSRSNRQRTDDESSAIE